MLRLGILGSTKGTDLEAIISAINNGSISAKINLVLSNKENAIILERAKKHNLKAEYLSDHLISRDQYATLLTKRFLDNNVNLILLIGFMKILANSFCKDWQDKIINVHPSLLPKYSGGINSDVHSQVLKNGDKESGCTIHYVTSDVDKGPIIIQKKCKVQSDDTVDSLKERVQRLEGRAFIEAINLIERQNHA